MNRSRTPRGPPGTRRRHEEDPHEHEEGPAREHPQAPRSARDAREKRVRVRDRLRDLHGDARLDPLRNRVVRGRHEEQRPLVLRHLVQLRADKPLEEPRLAALHIREELLVREELRLRLLLVGLMDLELLLKVVQLALRRDEDGGDDERETRDHERPTGVDPEDRRMRGPASRHAVRLADRRISGVIDCFAVSRHRRSYRRAAADLCTFRSAAFTARASSPNAPH